MTNLLNNSIIKKLIEMIKSINYDLNIISDEMNYKKLKYILQWEYVLNKLQYISLIEGEMFHLIHLQIYNIIKNQKINPQILINYYQYFRNLFINDISNNTIIREQLIILLNIIGSILPNNKCIINIFLDNYIPTNSNYEIIYNKRKEVVSRKSIFNEV